MMGGPDLTSLPDNFVIAIDGPAGSGKSTLAKRLAKAVSGVMIDTGAMYRSVTAKALDAGADMDDEGAVSDIAAAISMEFIPDDDAQKVMVNGEDLTGRIREPRISEWVSKVAAYPSVRRILTEKQRAMGKKGRIVMEGRDIGSHVFPDAKHKFFLSADDTVRAERRLKELRQTGSDATMEQVLDNIRERDRLDSEREAAPLVKPDGAVEIDTTHLDIDGVFKSMIDCLIQVD